MKSHYVYLRYYDLADEWEIVDWQDKYKKIKDFIFFLEGEGGRKRGRETSMCVASRVCYWGPGPQPRFVRWLGIEPATLCLAGQCSIHRATQVRAEAHFLIKYKIW